MTTKINSIESVNNVVNNAVAEQIFAQIVRDEKARIYRKIHGGTKQTANDLDKSSAPKSLRVVEIERKIAAELRKFAEESFVTLLRGNEYDRLALLERLRHLWFKHALGLRPLGFNALATFFVTCQKVTEESRKSGVLPDSNCFASTRQRYKEQIKALQIAHKEKLLQTESTATAKRMEELAKLWGKTVEVVREELQKELDDYKKEQEAEKLAEGIRSTAEKFGITEEQAKAMVMAGVLNIA